jgi:hypothetical protein
MSPSARRSVRHGRRRRALVNNTELPPAELPGKPSALLLLSVLILNKYYCVRVDAKEGD